MKIEESKAIKEVREIRDRMYLDVKDMTPDERRRDPESIFVRMSRFVLDFFCLN